MWICQRCHTENHDSSAVCSLCGSQRAAGRFAPPAQPRTGRTASPPRVGMPAQPQKPERTDAAPSVSRGGYQAPDLYAEPRRKRRSPLAAFARVLGAALLILLPLLVLVLAVARYEILAAAFVPFLTGAEGRPFLGVICYILLSLTAVLLSALPGLWTLLLAKICEK